jgi:hypothetical protein
MKNEQSLKLHNFLYLLCLYILDISDIFRHFQTISDNIRQYQTFSNIFRHFQTFSDSFQRCPLYAHLKKNCLAVFTS